MPPAANKNSPVVLIFGDDDFAVKQRARQLYNQWCQELGGMDHEIIDGAVNNSSEALKAIAALRMALQTLPFFGSGKAVWLQNCSFLGDDRASSSSGVTETLGELAAELKEFRWDNVRLLISAGKVDKRRVFPKTIDKLGQTEEHAGWSADDRDWMDRAETQAEAKFTENGKRIAPGTLAQLITLVGPNNRQLMNEVEKLSLYSGTSSEISRESVELLVSRNKQARAFGLGDALGERNLPRLLKTLDEELWEMKTDAQKSEIGLLYGLITKVRTMLLVKELMREGLLRPDPSTQRLQAQLMKIPAERLPQDKRYNPAAIHPFVLGKAIQHAQNYTLDELIKAMDLLLQCNRKLVSSGSDEALILQGTLVSIMARQTPTNSTSTRSVTA